MTYEANLAHTQVSKSNCSLNSQRVSVIKWNGRELNQEWSTKSDFSITKDKSSLSSSDSTVKLKSSGEEGKYSCSFCKKSFKWRSHWKSHERIHTGDRPFECEICGKTFTRSDGLQCHKVSHITRNGSWFHKDKGDANESPLFNAKHPDQPRQNMSTEQLSYCSTCNRVFLSSAGLMKHFRAHKGKPVFTRKLFSLFVQRLS
jgi:KRAB domain-containing zinc finger protein